MPKLRDLHLEPFSLALARRILEAFPRWEPYFDRVNRVEAGLMAHVLQLAIPSANPDVRQPLRIVAELDRTVVASWLPISKDATWSIDWVGYAYGNPPMDWRKDASGFDAMVEWLREFVREERVAAVWRQNDGTSLSGSWVLSELAEEESRLGKASVVRSWRGSRDAVNAPETPFPPVIVYGYPESGIGKLVVEILGNEVEYCFATEHDLLDTDRVILLDPDWNMALIPSDVHYAWSDGRSRTVRSEEQAHPRLFIVRWDDYEWSGPWEEEGLFEIRDVSKDRELLRRHLLSWLRESLMLILYNKIIVTG